MTTKKRSYQFSIFDHTIYSVYDQTSSKPSYYLSNKYILTFALMWFFFIAVYGCQISIEL